MIIKERQRSYRSIAVSDALFISPVYIRLGSLMGNDSKDVLAGRVAEFTRTVAQGHGSKSKLLARTSYDLGLLIRVSVSYSELCKRILRADLERDSDIIILQRHMGGQISPFLS